MPHACTRIAVTPQMKAEQPRDAGRAGGTRNVEVDAETFNDGLVQTGMDLPALQCRFNPTTVSETGWPCVQHCGRPEGFVPILDDQHIAAGDAAPAERRVAPGARARPQRAMDERAARITKLESRLKALQGQAQD